MLELLVKGGRLIDPRSGRDEAGDLLLADGRVARMGGEIDVPDAEVIDARGLVVCPGLVDMHVHLREPGYTHKETITTGRRAAAAGGFTAIACMPNTKPVLDTPEWIRYVLAEAAGEPGTKVLPVAALSMGQEGKELTPGDELKAAGAVALSDDGRNVQSAALMRAALQRAKEWSVPILAHCEDEELVKNYAVNEGAVSRALGLPGRPAIAEELIVARDGLLARETGGAVHICHVSTAGSVALIRAFKNQGVNITCETCPQYFSLTEAEVLTQGTLARVNPPLRVQEDVLGIIQGLQDGTIDAIATDHAPHHMDEKARGLAAAPSGMVGLETALAVTLTALYHTKKMGLLELLRKLSENPARLLGYPAGFLAEDGPGDVTIFDPGERWIVEPEKFHSMGRNTPLGGREVRGRIKYTIVDGAVVYRE